MESILTSIKSMLPLDETYDYFDPSVIMHINSAFFTLSQIGVGPKETYSIKDKTNVWSEFMGESIRLEAVKLYIYMSVRLSFDPPTSSFVLSSMETQMQELEWRLKTEVEKEVAINE